MWEPDDEDDDAGEEWKRAGDSGPEPAAAPEPVAPALTWTREDLLKQLDLEGVAARKDAPAPLVIEDRTDDVPAGPSSPYALKLDAWDQRRGEDLVASSTTVRALELSVGAAADCYGAAYLMDPEPVAVCADPKRLLFFRELLRAPGYLALHETTRLRAAEAQIAAETFALQWNAFQQATSPDEFEAMSAAAEAVTKADEEVAEATEACAMTGGGGLGTGPLGSSSYDPDKVARLYRRVRNSASLRLIAERTGRFRMVARSRQRKKLVHGADDVVGVTLGSDPGRLIASELALLALPETEDDVLRRLAESRCMLHDHRASVPIGAGPILATVDQSGSMNGEKIHMAKALALSLAYVARSQKRWCGLVSYTGAGLDGKPYGRLLALPPSVWNEEALLDWLEEFVGGGSDLDVPVRELPDYYIQLGAPAGKTDLVMITDAECHIPDWCRENFNAWKTRAQVRAIALVLNYRAGDLTSVCDEVHLVRDLAPDSEEVGRVLSI